MSEIAVLVICAEDLVSTLHQHACLPSTEEDARRIAALVSRGAAPPRRGESISHRIVRLTRMPTSWAPMSDDDWRPFGCRLLDERHPIMRRLTEADLESVARQMLMNRNTIPPHPTSGPDGRFDHSDLEETTP